MRRPSSLLATSSCDLLPLPHRCSSSAPVELLIRSNLPPLVHTFPLSFSQVSTPSPKFLSVLHIHWFSVARTTYLGHTTYLTHTQSMNGENRPILYTALSISVGHINSHLPTLFFIIFRSGPLYSPPSINVTFINVNSLYLLTKLYSPHIAN